MFCKPPHPVYIVLFRGDDTDFVGNQEIIVKITTERNISGCKAYFKYMGNIQTFDAIPEDKELHLVFSREQTKDMPLGTWDAELYLIDENGKRMTVNNRIHMLVTNSVREAYFPDDPQAVSVVISANKYIEDAEVSADGKTLTLTKKDGTEVSFSGGGGSGGTNDYNDLENKPSINGTTLTGNVNLATPEQLSLKADKATTLAGYGITDAATKTELDEVDQRAANAFSYLESNLASKADKSALDNHEGNTKNPHKVTAAQVGALPISGGTLTGDLAVGEEHTASRKLTVAAENEANGITLQGGKSNGNGSRVFVGGSTGSGGSIIIEGGGTIGGRLYVGDITGAGGGAIEVSGMDASIKKNDKEVATEEQLAEKADKATTLAGYGITDAATMASLAPEYSPSSAYAVGAFVYHDGNIYQCTTAIADGGEAWNAAHWELRKLDDFFTESNSLLTGTIAAKSIPAFSSSSTYEVGEIVIYDGVAYKCVTAITAVEEWTAAHWTLATDSDLAARLKGLKSDGTATDAFATSLLGKPTAKEVIDEEIIEKGTAPDAHLEAPTDERLKLILADSSVAYDSANALPYKLTSAIGDRVIATMTLTAASTDIALPTIAANDTTVKDFILDVTNAYAVDGVATDAGINIPRTDFKLVTRDGESLTDVTTVKAGKSAFLCFTQKSPVVVDGTTYPCWCVIQLPFGDPS